MYQTPTADLTITVSGWQQENNLVFIKLPTGQYQVGDEIITVKYDESLIIDNDKINNVFRINHIMRTVRYENVDTKETKSITDYFTMKRELDVSIETEEGTIWPSVSTKHQYQLFNALWQPVLEPAETKHKVIIHIQGAAPNTSNPFIVPIRKISGDLTNTLYMYNKPAHIVALVKEQLIKHGYRSLDTEPPTFGAPKDTDKTFFIMNDTIEFAKIFNSGNTNSTYLSIEIPALKEYEKIRGTMSGTYEDLKTRFDVIESDIKKIMLVYFNKSKLLYDIGPLRISAILGDLDALLKNLRTVESMKKTQKSYDAALSNAKALVKNFQKAVSEEFGNE